MDQDVVLLVAAVWTLVITFIWIGIAYRATKAHEKLANEVAKMVVLQKQEFQKAKSKELEELRRTSNYPRFQKNAPPDGDEETT